MAKKKKKVKQKEPLRLMRWADDGYPPIDLSNELKGVIELIQEVRKLRKEVELTYGAIKYLIIH